MNAAMQSIIQCHYDIVSTQVAVQFGNSYVGVLRIIIVTSGTHALPHGLSRLTTCGIASYPVPIPISIPTSAREEKRKSEWK